MSRADRLASLCEETFQRLEEGDLEGARKKVALAARIDPQHPEVLSAQAAIAAIDGELDEAQGLLDQALERAPEHVGILIQAADLSLALDPERAVVHARKASELAEEEEELVAAIMVLAEAQVACERPAEARAALSELATSAIDEPDMILDVAHAFLNAQDPTTAELWLRRLTSDEDPRIAADAWHAIGLCREAKGDRDGMINAWLETLRLDGAQPEASLSIGDDDLETVVEAALDELPEEVHTHLANVPLLVDDLPDEHLVREGLDPRLVGLFSGTPLPEQSTLGGVPSITNIHLYRKNLERIAGDDPDSLADEIRITVLHETAHYFGLDDEALEKLGLD
ncbi:MAG TPA: metallopeptidase family protein [Kofleriaceae bacterium]|nr:metallopeptidase family protein [Kofleriaceae bacterium]